MATSVLSRTSTNEMVYKGKITHRSWQQLPPEIIRLIATQYLLGTSATSYCPQTWDARENWHRRIVYTVLRDANDVEKLMRICPSWAGALETHLFWHQACTVIDPHDTLAHHAIQRPPATPHSSHTSSNASSQTQPSRITPFKHFRNMTNCSCYVCRINFPQNSNGLATAKRTLPTPYLGSIPVCREHRKNSFCGLCLREAPPFESENEYNVVGCVENEDEESWPGVDATCRACRDEWLWRRVAGNPRDREAVGGHKWNSSDWETRQAIEAFIEMGEGTIADVVMLAQEKLWLRKNTKLGDMLSQALAASRYTSREEGGGAGYGSAEEDLSEDEDAEDEDDPELMSLTEDAGGVRELAISDWARNRILDGHWFSPADQWYCYTVPNRPPVVRAVHPCPWNRDATYTAVLLEGEEEAETDAEGELLHPRPSTVRADVPPSFQLCEQAYVAFQKQMRGILLPAMINVVRRVVIECGADGVDPAMRAARMDMEDVVVELRDEAVWYNGIDWLERRANGRREGEERKRREVDAKRKADKEERKDGDGDDSSASSKSDGSHTTSPVLSTTTLQTTPSPPPSEGKKDEELAGVRPVTIPVSPVLESPVLLHPIPYVPVTVSHLPHYSMESFKMVWREACAPLYHCRCKICERAMVKATGGSSNNSGNAKPTTAPRQAEVHPKIQIPIVPTSVHTKPVEIKIDEVHDLEGEEEMEEEEEEEEEKQAEEEEEGSTDDVEAVPLLGVKYGPTARKRRSEELDEDAEGELDPEVEDRRPVRNITPPKRARRGEHRAKSDTLGRLKKRGSEELDEGDEVLSKRLKVEGAASDSEVSPPTSATGTGESDSVPSAGGADEDGDAPAGRPIQRPRPYSYARRSKQHSGALTPGRGPPPMVSQADLDQLYAFEAEVDV